MMNVSFGSSLKIPKKLTIKSATAKKLSYVINKAFTDASRELGEKVTPLREVTAKSLQNINPDSFVRQSGRITKEGIEGFNSIYRDLGLNSKSTLAEFGQGIKNYLESFAFEGRVDRFFDYFAK